MDIKTYIESGALELYVLGELTEEERAEVQSMMAEYPEVREEVDAIEAAMQDLATQGRMNPRPELRMKVMQSISGAATLPLNADKPMHRSGGGNDGARYLAAASVVLFLIAAGLAANFGIKWKNAEERVDQLSMQHQAMADNFKQASYKADSSMNRLNSLKQSMAIASDPHYSKIKLKGLDKSPESSAVVFWNPEDSQVYLDVQQLPIPPSDMQYQLWALADGKPVDAGVFSTEAEANIALQRMKGISKAQAFAVTLEKRGGSPTPNLEALYLMGEV